MVVSWPARGAPRRRDVRVRSVSAVWAARRRTRGLGAAGGDGPTTARGAATAGGTTRERRCIRARHVVAGRYDAAVAKIQLDYADAEAAMELGLRFGEVYPDPHDSNRQIKAAAAQHPTFDADLNAIAGAHATRRFGRPDGLGPDESRYMAEYYRALADLASSELFAAIEMRRTDFRGGHSQPAGYRYFELRRPRRRAQLTGRVLAGWYWVREEGRFGYWEGDRWSPMRLTPPPATGVFGKPLTVSGFGSWDELDWSAMIGRINDWVDGEIAGLHQIITERQSRRSASAVMTLQGRVQLYLYAADHYWAYAVGLDNNPDGEDDAAEWDADAPADVAPRPYQVLGTEHVVPVLVGWLSTGTLPAGYWKQPVHENLDADADATDQYQPDASTIAWMAAQASVAVTRTRARAAKPDPQPFGVSPEGAERLVAQWMRHLGAADAEATRHSRDDGIDVISANYVAQVKHLAGSVAVESVRAFFGVATRDGRFPLFFTSGRYTSGCIAFADAVGMGLFTYSAEEATLTPLGSVARRLVEDGLD